MSLYFPLDDALVKISKDNLITMIKNHICFPINLNPEHWCGNDADVLICAGEKIKQIIKRRKTP